MCKLCEDGKTLSMTWVLSPFPLFTAVQYCVVLFSPNHFTPTSSEEHDSCVPVETVQKKTKQKEQQQKKTMLLRGKVLCSHVAQFLPLICSEQHICSKQQRSKALHLKKCNQKCLGCCDSMSVFIFGGTNKAFLPSHRRRRGRRSANPTRHPCFVKITIIGTHVWKYYVCGKLFPVFLVLCSWGRGEQAHCLNRLSNWSMENHRKTVKRKKNVMNNEGTLWRFVTFVFRVLLRREENPPFFVHSRYWVIKRIQKVERWKK